MRVNEREGARGRNIQSSGMNVYQQFCSTHQMIGCRRRATARWIHRAMGARYVCVCVCEMNVGWTVEDGGRGQT